MSKSNEVVVRRQLTDAEERMLRSVAVHVSFPAFSQAQRFISDQYSLLLDTLSGKATELLFTEKQARYLAHIAWRYRKQLPPEIVTIAALKGGAEKYERKPDEERYLVNRERRARGDDTATPDLFA